MHWLAVLSILIVVLSIAAAAVAMACTKERRHEPAYEKGHITTPEELLKDDN